MSEAPMTLKEIEAIRPYTDWCRLHGCDHAHCPHGCDHPQPFLLDDGRLICGRCAIIEKHLSEMVPCTPDQL